MNVDSHILRTAAVLSLSRTYNKFGCLSCALLLVFHLFPRLFAVTYFAFIRIITRTTTERRKKNIPARSRLRMNGRYRIVWWHVIWRYVKIALTLTVFAVYQYGGAPPNQYRGLQASKLCQWLSSRCSQVCWLLWEGVLGRKKKQNQLLYK